MNQIELFLSINGVRVLSKNENIYNISSDDISDIGEISDGCHTFNSLYDQRLVLFAALCNTFNTKAWKSYKHSDGILCFGGGWFIVGVDTPEGTYTYHYKNEHWDLFKCKELEEAPVWDGHTDKDVKRLLSLDISDVLNSKMAKGVNNECGE